MTIYVTRHGQTAWNEQNMVCGATDIALSPAGKRQAEELALKIKDKPIDLVFSSPLVRAAETAEILCRALQLKAVPDCRLAEQNYGIFEGAKRDDPGFLKARGQFAHRFPKGESTLQLAQRVYSFLDELEREYSGKNILLVCHNYTARVIRSYFVDMDNEEFFSYRLEHCAFEEYTV